MPVGSAWCVSVKQVDHTTLQERLQQSFTMLKTDVPLSQFDRWITPRPGPAAVKQLLSPICGCVRGSANAVKVCLVDMEIIITKHSWNQRLIGTHCIRICGPATEQPLNLCGSVYIRWCFHPTQRIQRKALLYLLTQATQATQEKYASNNATNAMDATNARVHHAAGAMAKTHGKRKRCLRVG